MTKMTRKEALQTAVEIMTDWMNDNFETGCLDCSHTETAITTIKKMIAQIDKQSSRPKGKTEARMRNEQLAVMFIAAIRAADKLVNATWIAEHVNGTLSPQRGTHVAKIAIEWGAVREVEVKKRTYYEFIPEWGGCPEFAQVAQKMRR